MFIIMVGLYGIEGMVAYYRKNGDCFDFVSDIKFASELTEEECERVLKYEDWYCKQYNADHMERL